MTLKQGPIAYFLIHESIVYYKKYFCINIKVRTFIQITSHIVPVLFARSRILCIVKLFLVTTMKMASGHDLDFAHSTISRGNCTA